MSDKIKTEKGIETVPKWIAKYLFSSNAMYLLTNYIKNKIPPNKQENAKKQVEYFYKQFYIINN